MILRSFAVRGPNGAIPREGRFTARVTEFLGLAPRYDGFAILALCDEKVRAGQGIIVPDGFVSLHSAEPGAERWDYFVRVDGEPPPPGRRVRKILRPGSTTTTAPGQEGITQPRFLGGAAMGDGVAFVFVAPHDAPEGMEYVE
jgi:hypothetical protein